MMPANTKAIFQEMFANFQDYYVLIGGTATSIVLDSQGFKSRTTKDYDMVIIDELKNKEFYDTLNHFLELGEYQGSQKDEKAQLFRFTTNKPEFPSMIELFSILPEYPLKKDSVLSNHGLIIFKAKAWLDMRERSATGTQGLSKAIKKHLNDITRLTALLVGSEKLSNITSSDTVKADMHRFVIELESVILTIPQNDDILLNQNEVFEILKDFLDS